MAPYGVSITKQVAWRGVQEQFSNVYHYDMSAPFDTESGWADLIDAIVAIEKPIHRSVVTWVQGRVWGPTDQGPAASVTQLVRDLSGPGTGAGFNQMPHEMTVVAQFFLGRSPTTQRKRFLRKFYHSCGLPISTTGSAASMGNEALNSADKTPFEDAMNSLKTLTVGGFSLDLCAPNGDHLPLASSPTVLNHLHVRQFHQ